MNRKGFTRLLPLLAACTLVVACTANGVREDDESWDSVEGGEASPGDLYVRLAIEYLRQGQTDTALRKAEKALSEDPGNADAHIVIAGIYQRLGQGQLAEKHLHKAISLKPNDPYILNAYASFLCDQRKFAEAEAQYKKALANPSYPSPWIAMTNMGTCAKRSGNNSKAETYYAEALKAQPAFAPALAAMADLDYRRGRYKSAKAYLDSYFKETQPTPQVLLLAVRVERKLGSRKRAKTYAQLLRTTYPGSPEARQL
jgi:type IV pilus assembly protein PilF